MLTNLWAEFICFLSTSSSGSWLESLDVNSAYLPHKTQNFFELSSIWWLDFACDVFGKIYQRLQEADCPQICADEVLRWGSLLDQDFMCHLQWGGSVRSQSREFSVNVTDPWKVSLVTLRRLHAMSLQGVGNHGSLVFCFFK